MDGGTVGGRCGDTTSMGDGRTGGRVDDMGGIFGADGNADDGGYTIDHMADWLIRWFQKEGSS